MASFANMRKSRRSALPEIADGVWLQELGRYLFRIKISGIRNPVVETEICVRTETLSFIAEMIGWDTI
jgi:hypothetical protein